MVWGYARNLGRDDLAVVGAGAARGLLLCPAKNDGVRVLHVLLFRELAVYGDVYGRRAGDGVAAGHGGRPGLRGARLEYDFLKHGSAAIRSADRGVRALSGAMRHAGVCCV